MEPTRGDGRSEVVSASGSGEIDRSLPPPPPPGQSPPPQPPSIPESCQRPLNRAFIPATVLVVVLPIVIWHLRGPWENPEAYLLEYRHTPTAPNWLNELAHPIGPIAVIVMLAALGWLMAEYWLRSWRNWWFVVLGALCLMGIYAAMGGRAGTTVYAVPDPGDPYWPNIEGWGFLLGAPIVYGALLVASGVAIHKINPSSIIALQSAIRVKSRFWLYVYSLIPGLLVFVAVFSWKLLTADSIRVFLEDSVFAVTVVVFLAVILSPILAIAAALLLSGMIVIWFVLFRSADFVLRRRVYW